jgi:hypothetical protein
LAEEKSQRGYALARTLESAEVFEGAVAAPDLVSHRANIALLDVLIERESQGAVSDATLWSRLNELYQKALRGDVASLKAMAPVLERGLADANRVERVRDLIEQQRRHIASEVRRQNAINLMAPLTKASDWDIF